MKKFKFENKLKTEKKNFIGYETFIISGAIIIFCILGIAKIKFSIFNFSFNPNLWLTQLLGFWARPTFIFIIYLATMEFIRRKVHRAIISKLSSVFLFFIASTIIFDQKAGLLGVAIDKITQAFINERWVWILISLLLYVASASLFIYKKPFTLFAYMVNFIQEVTGKGQKITIKKETSQSSNSDVVMSSAELDAIEEQAEKIVESKASSSSTKVNSVFDLMNDEEKNDNDDFVVNHNSATIKPGEYPKKASSPKSTINYKLPSKELLKTTEVDKKVEKNKEQAKSIQEPLVLVMKEFNIPIEIVNIIVGPSVTRYEFKIPSDIKVSRITAIEDNIKMQLQARSIRIQAPIPGKALIGIEIPNRYPSLVDFKSVVKSQPVEQRKNPLSCALGKDIEGKPSWLEINKTPHMLVAGATGSGKSVCINTILASIILHAKPDEVRLLLVDPKMVEFTPFRGIPHLLAPIITNPQEATYGLAQAVEDMEQRYKMLSQMGVRNIEDYNRKVKKADRLPYIVIVIDELADLMMVASKEVETSIARITQKARAAGIHLVLATQRPSTDVVTGLIKSNIPTRISFAVATSIDSRTILDSIGAEKLLGKGDMLVKSAGSAIDRYQGAFIDDDELEAIVSEAKKQATPEYAEQYVNLKEKYAANASGENSASATSDPLYDEIKRHVIETQKASSSLLMRRFSIGYGRAARIIDALEAQGVVGPAKGSKPRNVLIQ